jgi:hypothetical protein
MPINSHGRKDSKGYFLREEYTVNDGRKRRSTEWYHRHRDSPQSSTKGGTMILQRCDFLQVSGRN